jgi:hypothetical protein
MAMESLTITQPDGTHVNTYAFGSLFLDEEPGLWGESVTIGNVGMVSHGIQTPLGEVSVSMEAFGTYQGLDILISAVFEGQLGVNCYLILLLWNLAGSALRARS